MKEENNKSTNYEFTGPNCTNNVNIHNCMRINYEEIVLRLLAEIEKMHHEMAQMRKEMGRDKQDAMWAKHNLIVKDILLKNFQ